MKKKYKALLIAAIFLLVGINGCARLPKSERSAQLIKKHFKKYSKKYPSTVYGKNSVKSVEILNQSEIHKKLVAVSAFITLSDDSVQRISATIQKGPTGWRFISWENDTGM